MLNLLRRFLRMKKKFHLTQKMLDEFSPFERGGVRYMGIPNRELGGVRYMGVPNKEFGFCGCYWPTKKKKSKGGKKISDDCEEFF